MVFDFSATGEASPKEEAAAATPPNSSQMTALVLPTFKWGSFRRLRCQIPDSGDEKSPVRPSEVEEEAQRAAMAPHLSKYAYFDSPRPLPHEGGGGGGGERRKRNKEKMAELRLSLSKPEIDEDFFSMTGHRAPRRPKRRPKPEQINLQRLFPGSLLPKSIAPDRYN